MPEQLSAELRQLQSATEQMATEHLVALKARVDLDHRGLRAEVSAVSKAAGVYWLTQSKRSDQTAAETSGSTMAEPALALVVARDTLGAHDVVDLPGLFAPSPGLLASLSGPLRDHYLEPLLAGERQSGFAFTEPKDADRHTWARPDGDNLIINGAKSYVTGGANADFVVALVEIDDADPEAAGPAMIIIDTDRPGVEVTRVFRSLDGSHHAAFAFTDVTVPRTNLVGRPGKGMRRAIDQVNGVRMSIAATSVGLARFVVEYTETHLASGSARPGRPSPSESELNRLRMGEMRFAVYAARSALYRTARIIDQGENAVNEIMAAKHIATETVGAVVDQAIQTVGGQALVDGHPLEQIYRRVRSVRLAEGASDVLALNVSRGRFELGLGRL